MKENKTYIGPLIFTGASVFVICLMWFSGDYDDTDDVENKQRSGLILHTDHGTGCQYLSKPFGGLIPRVDGDGNHMGCKK